MSKSICCLVCLPLYLHVWEECGCKTWWWNIRKNEREKLNACNTLLREDPHNTSEIKNKTQDNLHTFYRQSFWPLAVFVSLVVPCWENIYSDKHQQGRKSRDSHHKEHEVHVQVWVSVQNKVWIHFAWRLKLYCSSLPSVGWIDPFERLFRGTGLKNVFGH